jgi:hypothetical protein
MSPRERRLLIVLVTILALGGGAILGYQRFWVPLREYNTTIKKLSAENAKKDDELFALLKDRKHLDKARQMSLPSNPDLAISEYSKYLQPLLRNSGLELDSFQAPSAFDVKSSAPAVPGKKAGHQVLAFQVRAKGELASLVKALEVLRKTPLVHRVKNLTVDRVDTSAKPRTDKLNINMTVEAMVVSRAEPRAENPLLPDSRLVALEALLTLQRGPTGLALLPWTVGPTGPVARQQLAEQTGSRRYADLPRKNVFVGALPAVVVEKKEEPDADLEVTEFIRLETTNPSAREAFFRNLIFQTPATRVRAVPRSGYDTFRVTNESRSKTLIKAKVLRVDQRDVYFQVGEDVYGIHIGQTLSDAMRRPLSGEEMETFELTPLYDTEWASLETQEARTGPAKPAKKKGNR